MVTEGGLADGVRKQAATGQPARVSLHDHLHFVFKDYAFLRWLWHNTEEVVLGVWRSNQPDRRHLRCWKEMGIRSVISLRGDQGNSHARIERAACSELGLHYSWTSLGATSAPRREALLEMLDLFRTVERPFIMHCKSGADRTGLAMALYLMVIDGVPLAEARKQLSFRFLHVSASAAGILGHLFDLYAARQQAGTIGIEEWITREYDRNELTRSFRQIAGPLR